MRLSVILPTYNRGEMLGRTLRGLLDQTLPATQYEIVVVDDGSTDATPQVIADVGAPASRLRYFRQDNKGPAAARNYGVREARGDIVLFTGDDCIPDRRLLEEHLRAHDAEGDVGVVGHIAWHPELKVTAFMMFLEEGVQFGFRRIEDPDNAPYWAFYTSNCSLQRHWLEEAGGFDEDFRYAAWEDIELSYRLSSRGFRIIYRPAALTYHLHAVTVEGYLQRQRLSGQSAVIFWRKHPELKEQLGILHATHPSAVKQLYDAMLSHAFSLGIRDALRDPNLPPDDQLGALSADPAMLSARLAWIREVMREDDPEKEELRILRQEMPSLRAEYDRVTSRRLYRWAEAVARLGWRALGLVRRKGQ